MGFMKNLLGLHWGRSKVGRSRPFTGGRVFSPQAFSRFAVPATDQVAILFPADTLLRAEIGAFCEILPILKEFRTFRQR
jgi:hypothetical protein